MASATDSASALLDDTPDELKQPLDDAAFEFVLKPLGEDGKPVDLQRTLLNAAHLASLAYLTPAVGGRSNTLLQSTQSTYLQQGQAQAHFAFLPARRTVLIALPGSVGGWDWAADLTFPIIPWNLPKPASAASSLLSFFTKKPWVHQGFGVQFKQIMGLEAKIDPKGSPTLKEMLDEVYLKVEAGQPKPCLVVIGHSLGGALASLVVTWAADEYHLEPSQTLQYTFGSPRAGNETFAAIHGKSVGVSFRVVNAYDPVPVFPLYGVLDYCHVKGSIWLKPINNEIEAVAVRRGSGSVEAWKPNAENHMLGSVKNLDYVSHLGSANKAGWATINALNWHTETEKGAPAGGEYLSVKGMEEVVADICRNQALKKQADVAIQPINKAGEKQKAAAQQ